MNLNKYLSRTAGLLAAAMLAVAAQASEPTNTKNSDAFPVFDNHITLSGTANDLSGYKAAFQARTQNAKEGTGGIEELAYGYDLSKDTNLQIDARVLAGAGDYLAQFKVTKTDFGSFEAGYKRFRTFYDGAGGFFPLNNAWLPLYPRVLFVDRAKFFVNATLALPNAPVFTFSYLNELRDGRKDSTIWGDTDQTGVPIYSRSSLNPISANRKIVPAYLQLGERQQTWQASVKHTVGNTTGTLSAIFNQIDNLDTRSVDRYPGELKPFPAIPSSPVTLVPALLANNQNQGFDQRGFKENSVTLIGKVETVLSEKVTVYMSGSYQHANEDVADSRLVSAQIPTLVGPVTAIGAWTANGRPPYSFNLVGGLKQVIYTGNVGVETKPFRDLSFDAALRVEDYRKTGDDTAIFINNLVNQTTGAVTSQPLVAPNSTRIKERPVAPELDARYTGIKNVSLFATWDYRREPGDKRASNIGVNPVGSVILPAPLGDTDKVTQKHANFKIGVDWNACSFFTLRGEFFTKNSEQRFDGYGDTLGELFLLDYNLYGARFSAIVRPLPVLSFNTRYTMQRGKAWLAANDLDQGDSGDSRRYQIAETINWTPTKSFYVQGNVNVVYDQINTSYLRVTGAANDVVHNADNNYWDGSIIAGFVVDKSTDVQLLGTYYKANNYSPALATSTVPYGASGRDYSCAVGVKHKFNDRMVGSAKLGYVESINNTTGGFTNFHGPVAYISLDYAL